MQQPYITTQRFNHLNRAYDFADRFDVDQQLSSGTLTELNIKQMVRAGRIAAFTPETFKTAYSRRAAETDPVPYGFTRAELETRGLVLRGKPAKEPKKAAPAVPLKAEKKAAGPAPILETIEIKDDAIVHGEQRIQPRKNGAFWYYDVATPTGQLLRAKGFRSVDKAKEWLDALAASTPAPAPATPGGEQSQEPGNGGDVQRESRGSDQ